MSEINNDGAAIISFDTLLSEDIGGDTSKKEVVEKELEDALKGKTEDVFNFGEDVGKPILEKEVDQEEPVTTPTVEVVDTKAEEAKEEAKGEGVNKTSEIYHQALKSMFGEDLTHIIQEDAEGNDQEVLISDVVLDKTMFEAIVSSKMETVKEEYTKDKISIQGVSDITKDLIEIDKKGGNITELLRVKRDITDPLDQLDITTKEGQRLAIYLRKKAKGQEDDEISRLINAYESEGILEEKGLAAESELRAAVSKQIEDAKINAQNENKRKKDLLKSYKQEVKKGLSQFEMNDAMKNKVTLLATKTDDKGQFEIDKAYDEARSNPISAARLALFLLDEDEYIKQVSNKAVQSTKLESAKRIRVITKKSDSAPTFADKIKGDPNGITRFDDIGK